MSLYTVIMVDEHGWVQSGGDKHLSDPAPYADGEAHFGDVPTDPRTNPVRKAAGFHITKEEEQGDPPVLTTVVVPWTDCIVVGYDIREMTDEEKAARDAFNEQEKIAKEHAKQDAKPQAKKNAEKKFKDMGVSLGITFPLQDGEFSELVTDLMAQVAVLRADNKDKEANILNDTATGMIALWVGLGDDVTAPFIGDGGVAS